MKRLTIASTLPEGQNMALRGHSSHPEVIAMTGDPWMPPPEANALFTFQSHWKQAPADPPPGWPFGLEWIQIPSAGVDTFPRWALDVALVTRGPGIQSPAIGEFVIGTIYAHEKRFWDGPVRRVEDWNHKMLGGVAGKTLGIVGMGGIGTEVAKTALAIGMKVLAVTRSGRIGLDGVRAANLASVMRESDHVALSLPLTPETRHCINAETLALAQPHLHLINVSRGATIDQDALIAALDAGQIGAATLDVTDPEPLPAGHPLFTHPKVRLTPHVCGMSEATDARMSDLLLRNISLFLDGKEIPGAVDVTQGY
ncbi:NAD(P)-dependent oxidoreductase [Tropicimonas sp. IMCC34043]|uniref:NAD(P)-dependent oxidoreductase n=1 Tax=Tropicimonas sp. IMCC34043 TaxID=2248760 RepID=UPI0018E561C1|nr:NAD(P)-dependent oxidoreductase [Tropicimonas sp. IMCC34043]